MRKAIYILFMYMAFILFVSANCKRTDNCHNNLLIKNSSSFSIIYSNVLYSGTSPNLCLLTKTSILEPGGFYNESLRVCWEDELRYRSFDFYIVEIYGLDTNGFLNCDSIMMFNDVLHHYQLDHTDIDSLRSVNWTIHYR